MSRAIELAAEGGSDEDDVGKVMAALPAALFADAPTAMAALDSDGAIIAVNAALLALCDTSAAALQGRRFADALVVGDRSRVTREILRTPLRDLCPVRLDGVHVRVAGGCPLGMSVHALPLVGDAGDAVATLVHLVDSAEKLTLDEQRLQAQKLQALGRLAGGIAHDFNNVLTAVLGISDLLLSRHGPEEESFEDLMELRRSVTRGSNLVRQLLAFSRSQSWRPEIVHVNVALTELSLMLGRLLGDHIELHLEFEAADGRVFVDPGHLDQIVINIAVNARDAMPNGGRVRIRTSDVTIFAAGAPGVRDLPAGSYVLLEISDCGVGIPRDILPRIFDPFFTTKDVGAGTGLGLATVYGLIQQSRGGIAVDSLPGEGTSFEIYLPVPTAEATATAAAPAQPASPVARPAAAGDATVLLVEDEHAVRSFAARALKAHGFRVVEAADGEAAWEILAHGGDDIDVVVSDVVMPGLDGCTLVERARRRRPDLRVILMSGYAERGPASEWLSDDRLAFLAKPFSLAELVGEVDAILER
jgi:two-component system cell cycle sensor histidine kinase/response regulator CckA